MDELQAIYDDPRHATDIDLMCFSSWETVHSFDWERKVQKTTVDVLRGIEVGLAKSEQGVRMLLVRFVDTSIDFVKPSGGTWYNWKETQPSVWAIAFTAPEIRAISKTLPTEASPCLVIHREPWTEPSTQFAKAEWIVEDDACTKSEVTGVRIVVQASQEVVPQIHEVRFQTKGYYFRFTSSTDVSPDPWVQLTSSYQKAIATNPLPPDHRADLPPWDPPTSKIVIKTDYVAEGDSRIECEMAFDSVAATARMYNKDNDRVVQVMTSGKIILRNPTDDQMYIQSVSTDYSATGEITDTTHNAVTTRIGTFHGAYMNWGIPHPDVSWSNTTSWELPPKSVHEVCVETSIILPETATPAFGSKPYSMRLHAHFEEPLTVQATFVDNEKRTQTITWDYSNTPLEPRNINTYEDAITNGKCCNQNGIGESFDCLVFLTWDNPRTLLRTYLVVTQAKATAEWYIRTADTTGSFPMTSYTKFTAATDLARIAYDAGALKEIDPGWCSSSSSHCQIRLLVDENIVYGLAARVVADDDSLVLSKSAYLDPSCSSSDQKEET